MIITIDRLKQICQEISHHEQQASRIVSSQLTNAMIDIAQTIQLYAPDIQTVRWSDTDGFSYRLYDSDFTSDISHSDMAYKAILSELSKLVSDNQTVFHVAFGESNRDYELDLLSGVFRSNPKPLKS